MPSAARAARRTRSCRPRRRAPRRSSARVARRDQVGALVADAPGLTLASRAPEGRAVVVALAAGRDRPCRSADRAAGAVVDAAVARPGRPSCADSQHARARRGHTRAPPRRRRPAGRQGSMPALPAALGLPEVADAGDVRWSSSASPIAARRVVLAQAAQEARLVELVGEHVGAERGQAPVEARARLGHAARAPARRTRRPRGRRRAQHQPGAARGASPAPACAVRRPTTPVMRRCECSARSPSKRRNRCLP